MRNRPITYGLGAYSLATLRKAAERDYTRADDGKFSETGGGGGGEKAPEKKPKAAPKATPEEREKAKRAEQAENRAAVAEATGLDPSAMEALDEFASPDEVISLSPENREKLTAAGLVEQGPDGEDRLTGAGKTYLNAAEKGNQRAAADAMSRGKERAAARAERQAKDKAKEAPEGEADLKAPGAEGEGAEGEEKPKGGGGGGGGGSNDPDQRSEQERKETAAQEAATKGGLPEGGLEQLRAAADGGEVTGEAADQLRAAGLINDTPDGPQLSSEGRKALAAAEKGDARGVVAARQAGGEKRRQVAEREKVRAARETATRERTAERQAKDKARQDKEVEREGRLRIAAEAKDKERRRRQELAATFLRAEIGVPYGVDVYGTIRKHGSHNQKSHGKKGRAGMAGQAAYRRAREEGKDHRTARAEGKAATAAERAKIKDERLGEAAEKTRGRRTGAETRAYGTDPTQSYTMQHRLVDMGEIQASNLPNGGINPAYNPMLQPRDRSRAASQAQIDGVAKNLNADVLVTDFHRIDGGSPIIDKDGNVLSGNGRTLALQRAADQHPEQYAAYKARMREEAKALGIDPAEIDRMERPVLVRELKGDTDPAAFAREANSSATLRMSPLEQAKVDAGQISDQTLLKMNVRDGQDIDRALRDPANKVFVNDFLKTVPENERATLLTRNGDLNQAGLYRMKAAVYTRAFPGEAGERLAESMLESLDPDVKTIQNGISSALPNISRATALIGSGARDRDLDITEDFAKAVDVMARVKDNPAFTANTPANKVIDKYLSQSQMFDRELSPQQERILRHVDSISRKPTAVRDFLDRWAAAVEGAPVPGQASLFGDTGRMSKDELLDFLIGGSSGGGGGASQPAMAFEGF